MSEKEGIIELLAKLDEDDIYSLTKTVTQGLLKFENLEGKFDKHPF